MGLAASQARLLTITSRQADCEYQSMRYSHQKLELSRSMTDVSNEYQDALDATKLVYDFYGTGDTSTSLSYGLFMTPSELNGYMPTLITDASGKVLLSSPYAEAAKAAGIPQEGLGCLPSSTMRNNFLEGLCSAGLISKTTRDTCKSIEYSQDIGLGSTDLVTTTTEDVTLSGLCDALSNTVYSINGDDLPSVQRNTCKESNYTYKLRLITEDADGNLSGDLQTTGSWTSGSMTFSLADLLSGDTDYYIAFGMGSGGLQSPVIGVALIQQYLTGEGGFLDWLYDSFASVLNTTDSAVAAALDYAYSMTSTLIGTDNEYAAGTTYADYWLYDSHLGNKTDDNTQWSNSDVQDYLSAVGSKVDGKREAFNSKVVEQADDYMGFVFNAGNKGSDDDGNDCATAAISLNNIAKAFLTYYAQYMEGLYSDYKVGIGLLEDPTVNNLVTDDDTYLYTIVTDTGINSDQALIAGFYDALFNQLCTRGWVENNNVTDEEYLQEMLQTGKLYLATCSDDGYYYQGNYSTNTYIKEVTDDEAIAQAEAKYNTEKLKIENKEEIIDLKMKNLDTEISSLSTEYDTVKSLISKNAERSFKRYDA